MYKHCCRCSKEFFKKANCSKKAWELVKFCSMKCRRNDLIKCAACGKDTHVKGARQLRTRLWCSKKCRYSYPTVDYTTHEYRAKPNIRFHNGRRVAKGRGLSFDLTLPEYSELISRPCFYCNNKVSNVQNEVGVGLDRLVNSLGYSKENVIPCCGVCNRMRSDVFSVEETKVAVEAILRLRTH